MPPKFTFFTEAEAKGIEPDLMAMLDMARKIAGKPFIIDSGLRLAEHNAQVGGLADSSHLPDQNGLSQAVDLACDNSLDRWDMVFALKEAGFKRIVIEQKHVHVDIDAKKVQRILGLIEKP